MKKILSITLLACLVLTLFSCSKKDDTTSTSVYQGNWIGTYSGNNDRGVFSIVVSSTGSISGNTTSTPYSQSFDVKGSVSNSGQFTATAGSSSSGSTFTGQMSSTTATGTWSNTSLGFSGTWTGSKK
ncbi:hypothetical protein A5893_03085 [Pedobacter psychrophilus]|uniref:Lipoprotein n=1 Tax=Pedobacter psychrophilus TaxID=1826909 RepID=A0A179DMH4_9SPHI|nr:hypothetical protein [Pedobacter psychrophilus]OAQ42114.1 hypothetical protein A5893_03085 [Pedobacter psychrophilus]